MNDNSTLELRSLAARIATAYSKANPTPTENIANVIQSAYHGLQRCVNPPAPPSPSPSARRRRRTVAD